MHFKIETILRPADMQDNCERCGKELDESYSRGSYVYDLIVLKCPQCKAIYAYLIDYSKDELYDGDLDETYPMNDHSAPLNKTHKKIKSITTRCLSKNCASVYSKGINDQKKMTEELNQLIQNKLPELYKIGLSLATVNLARSRVALEIRFTETTTKHITALFAAAIYAKANGVTTSGSMWQHKGEGASERQLEEIFGVSRKTIRKWVEKFS
jgi:hypothetical protein